MISLLLALLTAAPQVQESPVPPACVGATFVSWEACAEAAEDGTAAYAFAMINLGTQAYVQGDRAEALRFYDKAGTNHQVSSDVIFHAFRSDTYRYAGRLDEARADARVAWDYLNDRLPAGTDPADARPLNDEVRFIVLASILPALKDSDPAFGGARDMFVALPANDWVMLTQRANTLSLLGEHAAAVADSKRAVDLQPHEPMLQNNHCYTLVRSRSRRRRPVLLRTGGRLGARSASSAPFLRGGLGEPGPLRRRRNPVGPCPAPGSQRGPVPRTVDLHAERLGRRHRTSSRISSLDSTRGHGTTMRQRSGPMRSKTPT